MVKYYILNYLFILFTYLTCFHFYYLGNQNSPTTGLLQQILEQGNATYIFLKRLDGKIDHLEHKIINISTNQNNNIQTLNDDFLLYFPMEDVTAIYNIEALITNYINLKKKCGSYINISSYL